MRIVINTNYNSAGTRVCVDDLTPRLVKAGHSVSRNDWDGYTKYDLALFMAPDSDVRRAKETNPKILAGIMDPKLGGKRYIDEVRLADFLVVSSIEQRDIFLRYNKNIFIYYMFPDIKEVPKIHIKGPKDKIVIGYHGNKTHLEHFYLDLKAALEELAAKYNIELWAMYNIEVFGKWRKGVPKIPIKHIQWSEENYYKYLAQCDIGVVPSKIPVPGPNVFERIWRKIRSWDFEGHKDGYILKFKHSNNPGRIYVFSQFHIPVVADFTPSVCQVIQDSYSGFLVYTKDGWYDAMEKLIVSPELRNIISRNLRNFISSNISIDINFRKFLEFINSLR